MRMEDLMPGCKVDIRITQLMEKEDVDAAQGIYYTSIFDVTKDSIELQMPMVGAGCSFYQRTSAMSLSSPHRWDFTRRRGR